jgi:glycosyltransferase involved in cell wall biosynthesis
MRILFLISGLMIGGAETQTIRLTRALSARGHYVGLHILSNFVERLSEVDSNHVVCQVDARQGLLDIGLIRRIRRRLQTEQFDIVISMLFDSNIYARIASLGTGVKVVNTERSSGYKLSILQRIAHSLTRWRVDELIANSDAGRLHAIQALGYSEARCRTIWNGIDCSNVFKSTNDELAFSFETLRLPDFPQLSANVRLACIVGRLSPVKDHALAMRTLAALRSLEPRNQDWHLVIVGGAAKEQLDYQESLVQLTSLLNVKRFVHFVGASNCVDQILNEVDVLISTSYHEGFPNVILEAMRAGLPVISTDCSDVRKILPFDWQVVKERDPQQLAIAVKNAEWARNELAAVQKEALRSKFSMEIMVGQYESALFRLITDRKPAVVST